MFIKTGYCQKHLSIHSRALTSLPPEIGQLRQLKTLQLTFATGLTNLPPEIGQLSQLQTLELTTTQLTRLPPEIGQLEKLERLNLSESLALTSLPLELGHLTNLQTFYLSVFKDFVFPPSDIIAQSTPAILAYLRDYETMLMRQTLAGIAAGVGGIAGVMLLFRWRQRRGLHEKKKRA